SKDKTTAAGGELTASAISCRIDSNYQLGCKPVNGGNSSTNSEQTVTRSASDKAAGYEVLSGGCLMDATKDRVLITSWPEVYDDAGISRAQGWKCLNLEVGNGSSLGAIYPYLWLCQVQRTNGTAVPTSELKLDCEVTQSLSEQAEG